MNAPSWILLPRASPGTRPDSCEPLQPIVEERRFTPALEHRGEHHDGDGEGVDGQRQHHDEQDGLAYQLAVDPGTDGLAEVGEDGGVRVTK